jgi:hypothetical protein
VLGGIVFISVKAPLDDRRDLQLPLGVPIRNLSQASRRSRDNLLKLSALHQLTEHEIQSECQVLMRRQQPTDKSQILRQATLLHNAPARYHDGAEKTASQAVNKMRQNEQGLATVKLPSLV